MLERYCNRKHFYKSEWRVKVVGNQSCARMRLFGSTIGGVPLGAGSIEVATQCSDRVSSLVEYERRLNSWYGEGQHKSIDTIYPRWVLAWANKKHLIWRDSITGQYKRLIIARSGFESRSLYHRSTTWDSFVNSEGITKSCDDIW